MANYPVDNAMIVKVNLSQEMVEELQGLGVRYVDAPIPGSHIVHFPTGWECDHKAKTARHTSDGKMVELPKSPAQQLKIDSLFFGVN